MNSEIKKIGFFSSFWKSCFDFDFYTNAFKAKWSHIILHTLILILLVSSCYGFAINNVLINKLSTLLKDLPTIQVKNHKAQWDKDLKLPYIKKFPQAGSQKFYFIIDSGKNRAEMEEVYGMYAIFTETHLYLSDGYERREFSYKKLEESSLSSFFGEPLKFSPLSLSHFIAFCTSGSLTIILSICLLFLFPIFSLLASLIANIAGKWNLNLLNIFKLSFFANTPACLIQIIGCLFLLFNWTTLLTGLFLSWSIQIAYLITALKANKAKINSPE